MEIIPIEYCDVSGKYIHLNQLLSECAFEHNCGESEFSCCPLRPFFSKQIKQKREKDHDESQDMPDFYLRNT